MSIQQQVYTATPSQFASAAMHLDRQSEWTWFRVNGDRYVALPSGNSGKTYWVRAAADGCSCPFYANTLGQCSHMLSVYLQATEDELEQEYVIGSASLKAMRDLYPPCAAGCGAITEGNLFCDECSASRARSARLAAGRAKVLAGWL